MPDSQAQINPSMVMHPDSNGYPGEAIMNEGQGGIPNDPRTGQPMARVPVFVHPEINPHLRDMLDSYAPKRLVPRKKEIFRRARPYIYLLVILCYILSKWSGRNDLNLRPLKSHKRFVWRRLRDEKRYFPFLVVRDLYLEFYQLHLQALRSQL